MKLAREAEKQAQSGKVDEAVRILQGIDKRYPKEPAVSLRLAQLFDTSGQNGPALFYYRRYLGYAGAAAREDIRLRVYGLELVAGSKEAAEAYGKKLGEETAVVPVPTPVERQATLTGAQATQAKEQMRAAAESTVAGRSAVVEVPDQEPAPVKNTPSAAPASNRNAAPDDAPAIPRTSRNVPADAAPANPNIPRTTPGAATGVSGVVISNETLAAAGALSRTEPSATPNMSAPNVSAPTAIADGPPAPGNVAGNAPVTNPDEFRAIAAGASASASAQDSAIRSVNRRGIQIGAADAAAPRQPRTDSAMPPSSQDSAAIAPRREDASGFVNADAPLRTAEDGFFKAEPSNNTTQATLAVSNELQNSLLTIVAVPTAGGKPANIILAPAESRRVTLAPGDYSLRVTHMETTYPPKRRMEKRFDYRLRAATQYTRAFNGE